MIQLTLPSVQRLEDKEGRKNIEQKQKDFVVEYDRKMQYLESEAVSLQAAREIRLYGMSGLLLKLYQESKDKRLPI